MTVLDRSPEPSEPGLAERRLRHPHMVRLWLTAVEGTAMAVLVAYAGTPGWQVARAAIVLAFTSLALWLQASDRVLVVGFASLVAGLVGTSAGAGVGVMHLLKGGALVPTWSGLLALAASLPLLVTGTWTLVGRLPAWWRLLGIPSVYILGEFLLLPVTIGIYATNVPSGQLGAITPSSQGLRYINVSFPAEDGTRLAAWYVTSGNGAAVVLVPGSGSTRASVMGQGAVLARHGYGALIMDNRGHGTSHGSAMDFGWWGDNDLAGAVSYLGTRADVVDGRIAVLGESMGGEEAIGALGADSRIEAAIAEGVTGRTFADTGRLGGGFGDLLHRAQSWVTYTTASLTTDAPQPPSLAASLRRASPRPVLIVAGRDELAAARYLKAKAPDNVELLELPDTAHTAGLRAHPADWETTVVGFLDRYVAVDHR